MVGIFYDTTITVFGDDCWSGLVALCWQNGARKIDINMPQVSISLGCAYVNVVVAIVVVGNIAVNNTKRVYLIWCDHRLDTGGALLDVKDTSTARNFLHS